MDKARKKIAVLITHGMGEQIPMETLSGFVDAAWVVNDGAHWPPPRDENAGDIWFEPDPVTGSHELRRITTRWTKSKANPAAKGPRIDFFEFYWADLAEGTTVQEVWDWLRTLLVRWPSQVPRGLMGAWLLLWFAAVCVAILSFLAISPWPGRWWHLVLALAAAAVGYLMQYLVSPYIGDVARYVRADPRNIAIRAAIRDRGLKLLKDIHDCGSYERIIVVAHSLGSVIAYDLISLLWADRPQALIVHENEPTFRRLRAVELAAHSLAGATASDVDEKRRIYREAQRELRLSMRNGGESGTESPRTAEKEWLISDFVTLGSPLTHALFLLVIDRADFDTKINHWLFPTNQPQFELVQSEQRDKIYNRSALPSAEVIGPDGGLFSYFLKDPETWSMHHAAPFAAVRWTNIHDSPRHIFRGDIISGPLAPLFGNGIRDIDLKNLRGQSPRFSHTRYWSVSPDCKDAGSLPHIQVLHKALDLLDRPDADIWQATN